jgi:alkylated DNA repair dioxygenase AlkB
MTGDGLNPDVGQASPAVGRPVVQRSLFDVADRIDVNPLPARVNRTPLTEGAWIDRATGFISGADSLFQHLLDTVPWVAERRPMYDRVVDVPRLLSFYGEGEALPHPVLAQARDELSAHYQRELGEGFVTTGLCLYRDGRDSVAWHGDRIGRARDQDTMVAIISLGAARPLALRPRGGGAARRFEPAHGDLLVMGGSCQRTWEHAVPKTTHSIGARISIQLRPHNVF